MHSAAPLKLHVDHRCRPCRGEMRSGDVAVARIAEEWSLLAVVDALGHGPRAADVADQAAAFLGGVPPGESVRSVLEGLHHALLHSRGAAATVCVVRPGTIEAGGVGNVAVRVFGSRLSVALTPGILGSRMRPPRVFSAEPAAGTRIVIHSDGVRARFNSDEVSAGVPEQVCDAIMRVYARDEDDATILVADLP